MREIRTNSEEETVEAGMTLGKMLEEGSVVCLTGDLGTGKTAFTRGIAKGLGIEGYITSPTFTIINEYYARLPMYHFDVYRVSGIEDMFDIGFEEYLDKSGVVVIEWADMMSEILPDQYILVDIKKDAASGENARIITIGYIGDRKDILQ